VPYTIGLVLVGLAVGRRLLTSTRCGSRPNLVFYVFLPILLFEAAFNLEAAHLRDQWRRILALAVPGVLRRLCAHRRRRAPTSAASAGRWRFCSAR
jgi:CPA1 family monovalent cation:H+ antiporter